MNIKVYNGTTAEPTETETVFYIQSKGKHAGRTMTKPKRNCWEVRTMRSIDFEILTIVFESKILQSFLRGSCIPFLSLGDYKKITAPILEKAINENRIINTHYLQIRKIEENIKHQDKIKSLLFEMKKTISNEVFKNLSIHN